MLPSISHKKVFSLTLYTYTYFSCSHIIISIYLSNLNSYVIHYNNNHNYYYPSCYLYITIIIKHSFLVKYNIAHSNIYITLNVYLLIVHTYLKSYRVSKRTSTSSHNTISKGSNGSNSKIFFAAYAICLKIVECFRDS